MNYSKRKEWQAKIAMPVHVTMAMQNWEEFVNKYTKKSEKVLLPMAQWSEKKENAFDKL